MTTPDDVQNVPVRKSTTGAPPPKDLSEPRSDRAAHPTLETPAAAAGPRSSRDRWMITVTVAGLCVLAGVMATYILFPAVATLVDPSAVTWTGEGP